MIFEIDHPAKAAAPDPAHIGKARERYAFILRGTGFHYFVSDAAIIALEKDLCHGLQPIEAEKSKFAKKRSSLSGSLCVLEALCSVRI